LECRTYQEISTRDNAPVQIQIEEETCPISIKNTQMNQWKLEILLSLVSLASITSTGWQTWNVDFSLLRFMIQLRIIAWYAAERRVSNGSLFLFFSSAALVLTGWSFHFLFDHCIIFSFDLLVGATLCSMEFCILCKLHTCVVFLSNCN
jgi:hypothetical protein